MADIIDKSLKVVFDEKSYVLNFRMRNILKYEENTGRGVFGDVNDFFNQKFEKMLDLIACMLEDGKGSILSDFVYGLDEEEKIYLVYDLSLFALTCFSENVWSKNRNKDKKKEN